MPRPQLTINTAIVWALPLLLLGYFWLVQPALAGPFLFDDYANISYLSIVSGQLDAAHIGEYLAAFTGSPGRPLAALSFLINDFAWPSDPYAFKYTNLMIHLLNGVLLFGLLRQLAKASPTMPQHAVWPLLAMSAWLFHPIQVSPQMLVVQRMTLLAASFSLAGLWAYIALLDKARSWQGDFLAVAALGTGTLLAFLCKESGALLPLYALVLNATLLRCLIVEKSRASRALVFWACALPSLAVMALIVTVGMEPNNFLSRQFTMSERLLTQTHILFDYLKQILLPSLTGGGIYHDDYPIYRSLFEPISTFMFALSILAGMAIAFAVRKKYVLLSFSVLWFFAGHLMESTILPLELFFEHRNYLPLLGPVVFITALPFEMALRKRVSFVLLAGWLLFLCLATSLQASIWGSPAKIATFWSQDHPNSPRATITLANYHANNGNPQQAVNVLMDTYTKGLHYADLPLRALIVECSNPNVQYSENILDVSMRSIKDSPFTFVHQTVLQKLSDAVQHNGCPTVINRQSWWKLSDKLLRNPKYRIIGEDFIRIERAKMRFFERNIPEGINELEAAYARNSSIVLTYKIAEAYIHNGQSEQAEAWLEKGLQSKQPYFDRLMHDPKDRNRELIKQLQEFKSSGKRTQIKLVE